jgi:hypothetical protein
MKYILLAFAIFHSVQNFAQAKNRIALKGSLIPFNSRYYFNGYSKELSALYSANLTYLRGINSLNSWLIGTGAGYKTVLINEVNPVSGAEENMTAVFFTPRFIIRKEEFLGRKNRGFVEAGLNLNIGVNSKVVDFAGNKAADNELINSSSFFFSFGYQYNMNDTWKLDFGVMGSVDLSPGLLLNGRKARFKENAFCGGISYHF